MKNLNIDINQLTKDIGGILIGKKKCPSFIKSLSTDSRTLQEGEWFICLKGENFDAHDFISSVLEKKPAGIIFHKDYIHAQNLYGIAVDDPNQYLGDMASWWRKKIGPIVFAVTGSNGKTSTKEILAHMLKRYSTEVVVTAKNLNNKFGVPMTLLSIQEKTRYVVVELGSNHRGEISLLSKWTKPNFAVIVSIAESHIGNFKNITDIAQEKASIVDGFQKDSLLVLSPQISQSHIIQDYCLQKKATFQLSEKPLQVISLELQGTWFLYQQQEFYFSFAGKHQFANLQLVVSLLQNIFKPKTLQKMLSSLNDLPAITGRLHMLASSHKRIKVWDDSYNANLSSFAAAIMFLQNQKKEHSNIILMAAVGHMAELGEHAEQAHLDLAVLFRLSEFTSVAFLSNEITYQNAFEKGWQNYNKEHQQGQDKKQEKKSLEMFLPHQKKEASQFLLSDAKDYPRHTIHILVKGSHSLNMQDIFTFF